MIDIAYIRANPELMKQVARNKNVVVDIDALLDVDEQRRELIAKIEDLRSKRNELAGLAKGERPTDEQIAAGKQFKDELALLEAEFMPVDVQFQQLLLAVPNIPTEDTPVGASETENVVIKTIGEKPQFDYEPKSHWQIAEANGWLDKERAAKVTGSRFAYLKGPLVQLQFALVQWIMDELSDEAVIAKIVKEAELEVATTPFTPIIPPMLVRTEAYEATARLDGEEVTYKLADDELWLNASAEHSLSNMYMNETLQAAELPIRYIGYATSFRREAGSYGKDTEGTFRSHQFDKLEMESFTTSENGRAEHDFMIAVQEYLMQQLGLHYQVMLKCTADQGTPNARGVDIESWLPSQQAYRETHSADFMADYQARRLRTKVKAGEVELAHTNDATAMALSRGPIAIVEQYQQADGTVKVPEVLRPYMKGRETL